MTIHLIMAHKKKCQAKHALAQAHKKMAGSSAATAPVHDGPRQQEVNIQVADSSLKGDLERLSDLENIDDKIALKKSELIPKYLPIVQHAVESNVGYHSEVYFAVALWLLDAQMFEEALPICDFVIQRHMPVLASFKREAATIFCDEVWKWAEAEFKKSQSSEPYFSQVLEYVQSQQWQCHLIVHAQLLKLAAMQAELKDDWAKAVALYEQCMATNPEKHGVKTKHQNALKMQNPKT